MLLKYISEYEMLQSYVHLNLTRYSLVAGHIAISI